MKTSEVLTAAKELIADPANWMQGDYFDVRNDVYCFCSIGAIAMATASSIDEVDFVDAVGSKAEILLRKAVYPCDTGRTFAPYNDESTHSEVMEAFDKAIDLAKASE